MDIWSAAEEVSHAIETRRVGAAEVMQATLEQIAKRNDKLNAIVSLRDTDVLMTEARAADASPRNGWLHGIPIAIKDLADAKGLPTSRGSPLFAEQIATRDDLHVARLRAAGAIVIGKTNTPEFGLGSHTFNPVFGATKNPYDPARSCGGSSGGAAVALAAGLVSIADGSDMMGSLRNPAAWSNVYGMRPSVGVVPSEPRGESYLQHLSTNGPMARNPSDLARLLDTMAGPDPRQPFGLHVPATRPGLGADVAGRKVGWLGDWGGAYAMQDGILAICQTAMEQLSDIGLVVEDLPPPLSSEALWEPWRGLRHYAVACSLGEVFSDPQKRAHLKASAQWEIENGLALSGADLHQLSSLRSSWFAEAAQIFETYDILALPSAQVWPFPIEFDYPKDIAGHQMDTYHRWMEVMIPASLIGLPVVSVPVGFGADGLPMGLQLIGPRGADGALLQVAQAWHAATDWPNARRPDLG